MDAFEALKALPARIRREQRRADVRRCAEMGMSLSEASRHIGVNTSVMCHYVKRYGVIFRNAAHDRLSTQALLERAYIPEPNSGCWFWTKSVNNKGYGHITIDHQTLLAHRVSWEVYRGPIPAGMCVLHRCDTPLCINPDHLFLGTKLDNARDMDRKGRRNPALGERQAAAKLTAADALAIRRDRRANVTIAAEYGVDPTTISAVKKRETWRHV